MSQPLTASEIRAFLDWYAAMGVEASVGDVPTDWFVLSKLMTEAAQVRADDEGPRGRSPGRTDSPSPLGRKPQSPENRDRETPLEPRQRPQILPPSSADAANPARRAASPPDQATADARAIAAKAADLDDLRVRLENFEGCGLKRTAKNLCFYRGAKQARLMFIGLSPDRDDDLSGTTFVDAAGQMLDKMLAAIGLGEADVHLTNLVYWRPPGNRPPTPQEILICQPFLERQIELVDPAILVLLGGTPAQQFMSASEGIMRLRGKWRTYEAGGKTRKIIATLTPDYIKGRPGSKRMAWSDLLAIQKALEALAPTEEKP